MTSMHLHRLENQYKNNSQDADIREFWLVEEYNLISEAKIAPFPHAQHPHYLLPRSLLTVP